MAKEPFDEECREPPGVHFPVLGVVTEDLLPFGFPSIDMGPQLKVVERTRTATMLCAASGIPDPEISWFKDFLPVEPGASQGRIKQLRSGEAVFHLFGFAIRLNPLVLQILVITAFLIRFGGLHKTLRAEPHPWGFGTLLTPIS